MAKVEYLDLAGLRVYDGLVKGVISEGDAKSIKTARLDGRDLKFYRKEGAEAADTPDVTINLPKQDLSGLLEKIAGGKEGDIVAIGEGGVVVDSNTQLSDLAKRTEVEAVGAKLGKLEELTTTAKDTLVAAINEVDKAAEDAKVTVTEDEGAEGVAKSYKVSQGGKEIASIDIPSDMVVSDGHVETFTKEQLPQEGEHAPTEPGTYIVLTIANAEQTKLYIPVDKMVDVYRAQADAEQVQIAIDSDNVISATIKPSSIGAEELETDAVTTEKVKDGQVTKAKLEEDAQTSLGKADTALQPEDVEPIPDETIAKLFSEEGE